MTCEELGRLAVGERGRYPSVASDRLRSWRDGNLGRVGRFKRVKENEVIGRFEFERREKIWRQTEGRVESVGHQFTKTQIVF